LRDSFHQGCNHTKFAADSHPQTILTDKQHRTELINIY